MSNDNNNIKPGGMADMKGIAVGAIISIIVFMIADYKIKNFTTDIYKFAIFIGTYVIMFISRIIFDMISTTLMGKYMVQLTVILFMSVMYMFLNKSKIYYFKGIDRKFVKENSDEISVLVTDYKNNLDDTAEITFIKNRIIFDRVDSASIKKCLSLAAKYVDENRENYDFKDYMVYHIKFTVLPVVVSAVVILRLFGMI